MIPVNDIFWKVINRPDGLNDPHADDIYSLSGCVSKNFAS